MNNTIVLPFERNRYFTGKMLTSQDFLIEQKYLNNKRRFLNSMLFGKGILCGLSVVKLDETSIMIDSGVAVDGVGREIVLSGSMVRKLSALQGYNKDGSAVMKLMIAYDEKKIQPVYAANRNDRKEDYEYNRVTEEVRVFLVDGEQEEESGTDTFLKEGILYMDEDFLVKLTVPSVVCIRKQLKMRVSVIKRSQTDRKLDYSAILQFTTFVTASGLHETGICFENVHLSMGEQITKDIWVTAVENEAEECSIIVKASSVNCRVNDEDRTIPKDIFVKVASEYSEPEELVRFEIGKKNYEMRSRAEIEEAVCIAHIKVKRFNDDYEIEEIIEKGVKHYIALPSDESNRKEYLGYFNQFMVRENKEELEEGPKEQKRGKAEYSHEEDVTTGIVEIPIDRKLKKGEVLFSAETVHGLGKGNVFITLACEINETSLIMNSNNNVTIFGAEDIFPVATNLDCFDSAVKIDNDKGNFVVGIRAKRNLECSVIRYRWYAFRCDRECVSQELPFVENKRIVVETPTVVLQPGEQYFFEVRFQNMEEVKLGYELLDSGSGKITPDGIYAAPEKEGVFELRIYCLDNPAICTYAYAIVKRKE